MKATDNFLILYPKFYCELNFIEQYTFYYIFLLIVAKLLPDLGIQSSIIYARTASIA